MRNDKPTAPAKLGAPGRRLWRAVVDNYELRADEVVLLEKACRTADESARLDEAAREAPLTVLGSMGQERVNPILNEARQARALLAALVKQLGLPETEEAEAARMSKTTANAISAARARWDRAGVSHRGA